MNEKYKAVIFDMDGVIFDTEVLWKKAFEAANLEFGVSLSEEYRQSSCGKNEAAIREELHDICPELDADRYREYMLHKVKSDIECGHFGIKSGFSEITAYLKAHGYGLGLATSSHRLRAEMLFRKKGIDAASVFDAMVFAEDVGALSKPNPFIFLLTAKKLAVEPASAIVVEDSVNGIKAAVAGGFLAVMVEDLIPPDTFCLENSVIMKDLSQLRSLLEEK